MPSKTAVAAWLREFSTWNKRTRVPEPHLVMADPVQAEAFDRAAGFDGVLAPVYLFHAAQMCEVIRPGDRVLDLGTGSATQIGVTAELCPDAHFIGIDRSDAMLEKAAVQLGERGMENVELRNCDITLLEGFEAQSIDVVVSTIALHHLPDEAALEKTFSEIRRVLKPGGGVYLADLGLLHSEEAIRLFAYQYAHQQPQQFTEDYHHSLRAAFSKKVFRRLAGQYLPDCRVGATFGAHFMMAVKSPSRPSQSNDLQAAQLRWMRMIMPRGQREDLADLSMSFRFGGLKSELLWAPVTAQACMEAPRGVLRLSDSEAVA